jgi:hypothetical protein
MGGARLGAAFPGGTGGTTEEKQTADATKESARVLKMIYEKMGSGNVFS